MVDTASSVLRLASAIAFDALLVKACAAFCIFWPNSFVWSAMRLRLPGDELALTLCEFLRFLDARQFLAEFHRVCHGFLGQRVMCSRMAAAWVSKSSAILRDTCRKASTACLL